MRLQVRKRQDCSGMSLQAGGAAVAKACQGEHGENLFSLWELETCIKTADLLLWPHIKQAKETGQSPVQYAEFDACQPIVQ